MIIIQENDDKTKQIYQEMRTCFLSVASLVELHFQTKRAINFQPPMKDKGQPKIEHSRQGTTHTYIKISVFFYLPEHIYDRHIEVWGYLDVTLAAGWFQFTVFCLYDKSFKTGNEILREMSWIHLKTFSIISVTSKWMESSKLVFPSPKFFKVFIENLRVVDILSEWVPCQCCLWHFIYWFWYLSCAD